MNKENKPKIIVIVGPTACGKTALSIELAKKFNGEIVSADSRQIYKEMNIGTAKPEIFSPKDFKNWLLTPYLNKDKIHHYLMDIKKPSLDYSLAQYKKDAIRAIKHILGKNKLPILVGGTGLYIKAVIDNLKIPKVKPNPLLRKKLENDLKEKGLDYLIKKLIDIDPGSSYLIDLKNPRRVIRALEIVITTKEPLSSQRKTGPKLFDALILGIYPGKKILKERIIKRINQMFKRGLISEVQNLILKYGKNAKAFDAIGYKEIIEYLNNKISKEEALNQIIKNTINYAKRQMTWFRKNKNIVWIKNKKEAEKLVLNFIKNN
jgi:tRNA dimethylallyltransferase